MAQPITSDTCQILLTAQQAFPCFEAAVLDAKSRVTMGFHIFDMTTKLRSDRAKAIGTTWFDLLLHKLDEGVQIHLIVSDFDAIVRPTWHRTAWRTKRHGALLAEVTKHPDKLTVQTHAHGAQTGGVISALLWPRSRAEVRKQAAYFNDLPDHAQRRFITEHPNLVPLLTIKDGTAQARALATGHLHPTSHHQKLAVIDDHLTYIGGLDTNDRRYDGLKHARDAAQTWHDVQLMIDNKELAATALKHLLEAPKATTGALTPDPAPLPFLRTLSKPRSGAMSLSALPIERSLRRAHLDGIRTAQSGIYCETQFLRDPDLTDALVRAAKRTPQLSLAVILPGAPEDVAFGGSERADARYGEYMQAQCLKRLSAAFGPRLFLGSPVQPRRATHDDRSTLHGAPIVYVHSKVMIFDNTSAIVSSGNLNGRSMNWDTEAGVRLDDTALVAQLKRRCISHWLRSDVPRDLLSGPDQAAAWHRIAHANAATAPQDRSAFIVPHDPKPAQRFGINLPGVPEEMV
ncbi:phospholipase D-like domain-containing protein [Nereida sp. MMG025]|uniref:phospholipase D family protein n=1 Tax=Nereida sp. MMG025 TaxID=2909981 RepID=UPI001F2515E2|nr:phospholipase D-like domain-containing protein [Nereida sp. MMG025]MCF6445855.1 phospholipase D-like domain-containing protein [Nereida sp. MMG025]